MYPSQSGRRYISLELQELQFDLEVVAFADRTSIQLRLRDIDRLLEALQVLLGKPQGRLRQQNADELLPHIEDESALSIGNLRLGYRCLIARRLQPSLSLLAALEQITDSDIELLRLVQIVAAKVVWIENWDELRIYAKRRIGAEVGGDFLRLVLVDQSSRGDDRVVVRQR